MSGRSAARDMSAISCIRSSGMGPTVGMNSRVVPGMVPQRRRPGPRTRRAPPQLDGTGRPSPSRWPSPSEEEKPERPAGHATPPPGRPWPPAVSGDASARVAVVAHHHAADGGVADQEAGVDGQAGVDPVEVLGEGAPVPGAGPLEGLRGGCPPPPPSSAGCTRRRPARAAPRRTRSSRPSTVVTPWRTEGLAVGSHSSWAS